jgi:hypothetical protein
MPGAHAVLSDALSGLAAEAGSFAAAAVEAVELPHDLCTVWLTTCGPEVDLCALQLTPLQWTRLADCFSHAAPQLEALHSLHLPADVFVDDEPSAMLESNNSMSCNSGASTKWHINALLMDTGIMLDF